jgi:hypothetical protein
MSFCHQNLNINDTNEELDDETELQLQLQYQEEIQEEINNVKNNLFAENTINEINEYMYTNIMYIFKNLSYEHLINFKQTFFK